MTSPYDQFTALASGYNLQSGFSETDGVGFEDRSTKTKVPSLILRSGHIQKIRVSGLVRSFMPIQILTLAQRSQDVISSTVPIDYAKSVYRTTVGIGSAKIGLFSGAIYGGYQGSEFVSSGPEGRCTAAGSPTIQREDGRGNYG